MQPLSLFSQVAQDPLAYLQEWKSTHPGQQAVGYLCSYAPEELIWAMGMLPFRILASPRELELADRHLQAYSCQVIRQILEMGLSGELNDLDKLLFVQTCDSMQRLSDIFRLNVRHPEHLDLVLPAVLHKQSAKAYYRQTLAVLARQLSPDTPLTPEQIRASIGLFDELRRLTAEIRSIHHKAPQLISARDIFNMQQAAQFMDRKELLEHLSVLYRQLAEDLSETHLPGQNPAYKRLIISGSVCNCPGLYRLLEENRALIIFSDLCTGDRFFSGRLTEPADMPGDEPYQDSFLQSLVQRYTTRINCPCKFNGLLRRAEYLEKLAVQQAADGIIFLTLKFCDPHAFDLPYLRTYLNERGIPCLFYEIEEMDFPGEQFTTRCQAFLEMI